MASSLLFLQPVHDTNDKKKCFAFFYTCYVMRDLYLQARDKYCHCHEYEGPALENGATHNCLVCKAGWQYDCFDLTAKKEDLNELKKIYLMCEKYNFEMLLYGIKPFWLKCLDDFSKEENLTERAVCYIFEFRSLLVSHSNIHCCKKETDSCTCPHCELVKVWDGLKSKNFDKDYDMLYGLYYACVEVAVKMMSQGIKAYWLDEPEPFDVKECYDDQVEFYFTI